jgi:hypothetical protein
LGFSVQRAEASCETVPQARHARIENGARRTRPRRSAGLGGLHVEESQTHRGIIRRPRPGFRTKAGNTLLAQTVSHGPANVAADKFESRAVLPYPEIDVAADAVRITCPALPQIPAPSMFAEVAAVRRRPSASRVGRRFIFADDDERLFEKA